MFHQKQFKNYCRCHAINNFLGYYAVLYTTFDNFCDEFDKKNGMPLLSKNNYIFYNNGGNNNIFGHILDKFNLNYKLETFYNEKNVDKILENIDEIKGFFIFNLSHTWTIKKHGNKYYLIDSLKRNIRVLSLVELKLHLMSNKGVIKIT